MRGSRAQVPMLMYLCECVFAFSLASLRVSAFFVCGSDTNTCMYVCAFFRCVCTIVNMYLRAFFFERVLYIRVRLRCVTMRVPRVSTVNESVRLCSFYKLQVS